MNYDEDFYIEGLIEVDERERQSDNEQELIQLIHRFIDERNESDGEPPDEDTIAEGLDLGDDFDSVIRKAYELYWKR